MLLFSFYLHLVIRFVFLSIVIPLHNVVEMVKKSKPNAVFLIFNFFTLLVQNYFLPVFCLKICLVMFRLSAANKRTKPRDLLIDFSSAVAVSKINFSCCKQSLTSRFYYFIFSLDDIQKIEIHENEPFFFFFFYIFF